MAHAGAAVFFRNGGAEPAHFGHAFPQCAVIGGVAFQHAADLLGGAAFAQEAARLVAQLFQLVGKVEIHGSFHPTQISVARG